ncbi:hypothetical protein C8R45DRAFT_1005901 [Mycena sanguinolenta]|nr:hypothetical protein C8R45DRAFT_1005901 [Mycena sanguinolenta]
MSAADIQAQLTTRSFDIWPFTLLVYDYLLTLDWEVSRYWGPAFTLTAPNVLFFANRYGTLLGNIPVIFPYAWSSETLAGKLKTCQNLQSYHRYFIVATQVLIGVMLILRTYALYERSKYVLVLMLTVGAGAVGIGIWSVTMGSSNDSSDDLYTGCEFKTSRSDANSLAVAWIGLTVMDSTIFLLTLYKVFRRRRSNGPELFTVLLRDGSLYFGVMVMSNLANILTLVIDNNPYSRASVTTFTNVISSIMITRLMLNLRDPALTHMSGRLPQSTRTAGTVVGGSPMLDTNLELEVL